MLRVSPLPFLLVVVALHGGAEGAAGNFLRRPKAARLRIDGHEQRLFFCLKTLRGVRFRDLLFSDEKYFDCNDHECMWEWVLPGETVEPLGRDECAPNVHVWGLIGIGIKVLTTHCSKRGRLPRKVPSTQSPTAEGQAIGPKWSNGAHRRPDQKVP